MKAWTPVVLCHALAEQPKTTLNPAVPCNCSLSTLTRPQVDQVELETVVPQPGGSVLVLNGPHRGTKGTLQGIDTKRFQVGGRAGKEGAGREGLEGRPQWLGVVQSACAWNHLHCLEACRPAGHGCTLPRPL